MNTTERTPLYSLKGFKRISLKPNTSTQVEFKLTPEMYSEINESGDATIDAGKIKISVGGSLPGDRSKVLGASKGLETFITVE